MVRIATEVGVSLGCRRILGELRKLGIRKISRSTVQNILREHGIETAPLRPRSTWKEFIERHKDTLYACDFFIKEVWTPFGRRKFDVLAMIHIGSRKVTVLGITDHASGAWMAARARELAEFFTQQNKPPMMLMHDRDPRFMGRSFDGLLQVMGVPVQPLSPGVPNLNAHMERWIRSIKNECLDHFIVFGEKHLRYLVDEYVDYYNTVRPHQGIGNETIPRLKLVTDEPLGEVVCETRLGGLLKHYRRAA
ncbi:MAG: integrase core domain-containing protein [Planctomycetota bacterium]